MVRCHIPNSELLMSNANFENLLAEFERAIQDCQRLYLSSAQLCVQKFAGFIPGSPDKFQELMDDLHKGVLIKVYVTVVQADTRWSPEEKRFAERLFHHLWPGGYPGGKLRETANHVFRESGRLKWMSLVRPFQQIAPLRDRTPELEALIGRLATIIARADGEPTANEIAAIRSIQQEISLFLHPIEELADAPTTAPVSRGKEAVQQVQRESQELRETFAIDEPVLAEPISNPEIRLNEVLASLDRLIGLSHVKHEIRTLTNFLKMQQQREAAGLPKTKLSLHLVFGGNPGTGKTTVARIVGQIYGAMGILQKGHLIETDRSGLVAEYAGQTGPKTNKKVDEALDGVLFIDEAYSLVDESGDDAYGREALQALLKRMEDNRDRLVVILAGYSGEMDRLLRANPGLTSRFNTRMTFEDYSPGELGHIFGSFCEQNHYVVPAATQLRVLLGLQWSYQNRDERFGNARLVRNVFETAIRRLANRIVGVSTLTKELLTTLEPDDISLPEVPAEVWRLAEDERLRFRFTCVGCGDVNAAPASYLGRRVRCKKCQKNFIAAWGEPEEIDESGG
jgi:AAA+ superfamily predicted ATPase/tellurite resistance protein